MWQVVTFDKLSNDVDTTGTGSIHVVASRVVLWLSSVIFEHNMDVNLLYGKEFGSGTTN
jgi:hypothetical protein